MADSSTKNRINQLIREAQRVGDVYRARELLQQALEIDPSSEKANLWMATVSDDQDQREYYIQRVLEINPRNRIAPYLRRVKTPAERMALQQEKTEKQQSSHRISRTLLFFGAFSMLFMGFIIFNRVQQYQEDTNLAENGLQAIATVTDRTTIEEDNYTSYLLGFTFDAQYQSEIVTFTDVYSEVHETIYKAVQVGDQYEVNYLPEDPTQAQLTKVVNQPTMKDAFLRDIVLYTLIAGAPIDAAVVMWLIEKNRVGKKDEA
jgi:hypothetical protein